MRTWDLFSIHSLLPFAGSFLLHIGGFLYFLLGHHLWTPQDSVLVKNLTTVDLLTNTASLPQQAPLRQKITVPAPTERKTLLREVTASSSPEAFSAAASSSSSPPSVLSMYLSDLHRHIDGRKVYPSLSKRLGETGKVLLSLIVLRNGDIQSIEVKSASTFSRLNDAALKTVSALKRYKPLPDAFGDDRLVVDVPIEFSL